MKVRKIWCSILFCMSFATYFAGYVSGEFSKRFMWLLYGDSTLALYLLIMSSTCFLLAISALVILFALKQEAQQ